MYGQTVGGIWERPNNVPLAKRFGFAFHLAEVRAAVKLGALEQGFVKKRARPFQGVRAKRPGGAVHVEVHLAYPGGEVLEHVRPRARRLCAHRFLRVRVRV